VFIFRPRAQIFGLIVLASIFLLSACKSELDKSDPRNLTAMISVEGSDTMLTLLKAWAAAFKKQNPEIPISITSDDSGGGIAALINRTADLAAASRDMTDAECTLVNSKGVRLKKITVARDAIAIVVNPNNPVNAITLQQLEDIYMGKLSNWKQVGGKPEPIEALSREKSSGTFRYFQEHVLHGKNDSAALEVVASTETVIDVVEKDSGAIAYVGLGHAMAAGNKVKMLQLKLMDKSQGVSPSRVSLTADYPLSRPLIIFVDQNPKESVEKFVKFCMSDEGQTLVAKTGYVSIR
jgi:phosphate transport system substrate-binding protein